MGTQMARRYCPHDQKYVLAMREKPNHILHLLLSVITFGVWIIVWFFVTLGAAYRSYRCPQCGSRTKRWKWLAR